MKSDRKGARSYDISYTWNLERNDTTELTKQETHRLRKGTHGCQREVTVQEFGKVMYTLLYLKWIINKDLLYSTGTSTRCHVPAWMEEGFGGEGTHVYVWLSPLTVPCT